MNITFNKILKTFVKDETRFEIINNLYKAKYEKYTELLSNFSIDNLLKDNLDEVYCEIVYGMGETLVGSFEGQSLSFIYNKNNKNITIKSYPNKSIALKNSGFIFRSDSNTEDLEGFAGAGLFDSVPMIEDNVVNMSYKDNQIFKDAGFVKGICEKVAELGVETEKLFNGEPQDIEGVFYKGEYYIVQTRPQV